MLNKLLASQIEKHFGNQKELGLEFENFLKEISGTYNECERNGIDLETLLAKKSAELNAQNIQLRREADELKRTHEELGRILNTINLGFFSRDLTTNSYTCLSPGCEKIYGYSVQEFFKNSRLWYDVIHPEDRSKTKEDEERLNNEEELTTQYRIILKDKSIKWIELKIIPYFREGKITRVDGVVSDITPRKEVETERELMIKELLKTNSDLKQFSFITSHNLRAPLSNIIGILNLFDYQTLQESDIEIVEMLKLSAQQLQETINDLNKILIIKNNTNPELTSISIAATFQHLITSLNNELKEAGAEVVVDLHAPRVLQNKVYLESIFLNLISNALRYRSKDRSLLITITSHEDENGKVVVYFSDNGIGIDLQRHKERIFGLYQRFHANIEGQGLGLFIVKSQIEATGGKIDVESEPDKGTTFILTFKKPKEEVVSSRLASADL